MLFSGLLLYCLLQLRLLSRVQDLVGLYCNIVTFLLVIRLWNHVLASMRLLPVHNRPYGGFLAVNFLSLVTDRLDRAEYLRRE